MTETSNYMMRMLMAKTDEEKAAVFAEYQEKQAAAERGSRVREIAREYHERNYGKGPVHE